MNADPGRQPQNEPAVAFSVFHPLRAVAASNDFADNGFWIGRTSDGGRTWSSRFKVPRLSPWGHTCSGSDPSVVYSRRDRAFYLSTLCYSGSQSQVQVWKSADGGASWTPSAHASVVISNVGAGGATNGHVFYDKSLLAVDNTPSSPHFGRLYATYIRFHMRSGAFSDTCPVNLGFTDRVPTADPARARWSHTAVVQSRIGAGGAGPSANQWATPVVDPRGGLDIAYVLESCNSGRDTGLFFKRSTNGGRTFRPSVRIDKKGQFADDPNPNDQLPGKNASIGISPSLAVNPVTGSLDYVFENEVDRASSGADISFVRSTDHGRHWSDAKTISVTSTGDPAPEDQFFPSIAAETNGTLQVIWLDNRDDPSDVRIETFQTTSTDDGTTWTPNQDISSASWDPNQSYYGSGSFIGDYIQVAASTRVVYPVWTDGRNTPGSPNGETDIYTNLEIPGP
jgi:hypothetical protein